ncbi:MAG: hypothetical protein ABIU54_14605 [Candidatus Eisenbacteria bacterium]
MFTPTRNFLTATMLLALMVALSTGCNESGQTDKENVAVTSRSTRATRIAPVRSVTAGTTISVTLGSLISSENAAVGDAWHGTLAENVETLNGGMISAGSEVHGVVTGVTSAQRGSRAMLDLGVRGISSNGRNHSITANGEAVIAGSTRARNLGAIAGGAAAGALIGKVVGDGKNGAVGGLIGGAAATGVVATSKGYQVVLKPGTQMNFTVNQTVAMR